jgi:predicted SAM-dependent methyltransferase
MAADVKRLLNAGSGPGRVSRLAPLLNSEHWEEVRLDIDAGVQPDVVGSIADLDTLFPAASFDAILSSHVLEHLFAHEVYPALLQFRKVLKPDGFALIMCPDLEAAAAHILEKGIVEIAYTSPAGPIRPLDMIYGHSRSIEQGRHYMAHRTGFTVSRLGNLLLEAGFGTINVRAGEYFELCALAFMEKADPDAIQSQLASSGFDLREAVV